jgi:hypothetical protein
MPISHSIWKVGSPPQVLPAALLFSEQQLGKQKGDEKAKRGRSSIRVD